MKTSSSDTIFIEHIFNVSPDEVWKAWTEPFMIRQWFGSDPDGTVLSAVMDVQPGGLFKITFQDSNGTKHTCSGVYNDVEPNAKLSFTWTWENEPGVESFVILMLVPEGRNTVMKFEHAHVGFASAHNYKKGWNDTFLKLNKTLAHSNRNIE